MRSSENHSGGPGARLSRFDRFWLRAVEARLPGKEREFLVGDLIEELQRRHRVAGAVEARLWVLKQVFALMQQGLLTLRRQRTLEAGRYRQGEGLNLKGATRSIGILERLEILGRDLKLGARRLGRSPGPTAVVVATLAVGIGLNTLVFMLADAAIFRPLPFAAPDRLMSIETNTGGPGWYGSSEPELLDLQALPSFEFVGAWRGGLYPLEDAEPARRLQVALVTEPLLPGLGVPPALGRFPTPAEDAPGADPVVVVSHGFWLRELGGGSDAIGSSLRLGGDVCTVIGVMPAEFRFPNNQVEIWTPLRLDPLEPWGRNNHYLNVIARPRDGVSFGEARATVETLVARSAAAYPEFYEKEGYRTQVQSLQQAYSARTRTPMLVILGSVGLLLLLTCINVANVQLGRGAGRAREFEIRRSLGASRGRLIGELMAESSLLAGVGAALAVAVALAGETFLPLLLPPDLFRFGDPQLDQRVLLFTLTVTGLITLLFGLWPALRNSRSSQSRGFGRSNSGDVSVVALSRHGGQSRWLRSALVSGQVALASMLLIGCGMVARSLQKMVDLDPGYQVQGVLAIDSLPQREVFDSPQKIVGHYLAVEEMVSGLAHVEAVGSLSRPPLSGLGNIWSIEIEGRPVDNVANAPAAQVQQATPGAFEALQMPLLEGRLFASRDRAGSAPVVVVNEAFAKEFWPSQSALGKRMKVFDAEAPWMTVVGVVKTIRDGRLDQEGRSQWYVPHAQGFESAYVSPRDMTLVIKTSVETPSDLAPAVLAWLEDLDDRVVYADPRDLSSAVARSLALPRQMTIWLSIFAGAAILLAALGLYGVLSYLVTVRRNEMGIRLALGASPRRILCQVLGEGGALCVLGAAVGLGGGWLFSKLAAGVLYEVEMADPAVLGAVLLLLLVMGCLAPLPPAWRASRTDPSQVLNGG